MKEYKTIYERYSETLDEYTIDGIFLNEFKEYIENLISKYGEDSFFSDCYETDYGGERIFKFQLTKKRLETDEERNLRIKADKEKKLQKELKDRELYEKLKSKFGD